MSLKRYILPFFLSLMLHLALFASSPSGLLRGRPVFQKKRPVRLRVIGLAGSHREEVPQREVSETQKAPHPSGGEPAAAEPEKKDHFTSSPRRLPEGLKTRQASEQTGKRGRRLVAALPAAVSPREPEAGKSASAAIAAVVEDDPLLERVASPADSGFEREAVRRVARVLRDEKGKDAGGDGSFTPPVIASMPEPEYPEYSRLRGEEGVVTLQIAVDHNGRGLGIEVVRSSGHRRLDVAAVEALERARFVPAKRAGEPVPSVKKIAVRFTLKDGGK